MVRLVANCYTSSTFLAHRDSIIVRYSIQILLFTYLLCNVPARSPRKCHFPLGMISSQPPSNTGHCSWSPTGLPSNGISIGSSVFADHADNLIVIINSAVGIVCFVDVFACLSIYLRAKSFVYRLGQNK